MKECCIFAGAKIDDYSRIKIPCTAYIICADGGYSHAKRLGIFPDVVLGDFDTLSEDITEECEVIKFPSEKDDTDTLLAIKLAIQRGFDNIKIYGAVGGRIDHTFANIQSLAFINLYNIEATIFGDNEILTVITNAKKRFEKIEGYFLSIFSFSGQSLGVTTHGLKYNLNNSILKNTFPLGISNEFLSNFCEIEVKNGTLLIIFSKE